MISSKSKISPKTQEIFQALKQSAVELGPEAKMPTVAQLRRDYKVSIATLDTVLARLESQNVITRRQGSGIYVSPYLHKKTVGLVCAPEFFRSEISPFWSEIVEELRSRASLEGEVFRFYLGLPAGRSQVAVHEDLQADVSERRLDGVFFIGNNPEAIAWLEAQGVAVVNFAGSAHFKVGINYRDLIEQAVNALESSGCRRLALMSPFHYREKINEIKRSRAVHEFEAIVRARNLDFDPRLVWDAASILGTELQTYQEQGFEAAHKIFCSPDVARPDGLIIIDDMMTRGALVNLKKLGIAPNVDVKIVSHFNRGSSVLQGEEKQLMRMEIDPAEIVKAMFAMLNTLMDKATLATPVAEVKANLKRAENA